MRPTTSRCGGTVVFAGGGGTAGTIPPGSTASLSLVETTTGVGSRRLPVRGLHPTPAPAPQPPRWEIPFCRVCALDSFPRFTWKPPPRVGVLPAPRNKSAISQSFGEDPHGSGRPLCSSQASILDGDPPWPSHRPPQEAPLSPPCPRGGALTWSHSGAHARVLSEHRPGHSTPGRAHMHKSTAASTLQGWPGPLGPLPPAPCPQPSWVLDQPIHRS